MKPRISIITPSYNQGAFIESAIQSVLDQNYSNYEHVIIDNYSSDNTLEIINRYPHIKLISEKDNGQSDALRKGFRLATGKIIGWLNSDDVYTLNTFEKVVKELSNNSVYGVYSNCFFTDSELNVTRKFITHKPYRWMSLFHCFIPSTTFFFKKELIDSNIIIDENFYIEMDKDFFASIIFAGYKLKYIDDYFAKFRWHVNNKSNKSKKINKIKNYEGIKIINKHISINIPNNTITQYIYRKNVQILRIARFLLKLIRTI